MRISLRSFSLLMAMAVPAVAQPSANPADNAGCAAQVAAIERDMEIASAKGQMLRRQQLAKQVAALQARCTTPSPASRAASIDALALEIETLRTRLDRAEEQLRKLKSASP